MTTRRLVFILSAVVAVTVPLVIGGLTQDSLREPHERDNFIVREEMVPMRDGVRLNTVILIPKAPSGPMPILLERTPYDATRVLGGRDTTDLQVVLGPKYLDGGYIVVSQDIRGRYRSEGDYAMYRVPRGEFNRTETDETTDAWDTIDWLVRNLSGHNGKVGVWGTSYPGWLTLAAMRDPHPALAAAVPFNPVVDVWKADDWFHWGAFRAAYAFEFIYSMESRKGQSPSYPYEQRDLYSLMLGLGAAGTGLGSRLDERHEMWPRLMDNPEYTRYWKDCAADRWFENPPRLVPALHVHGLWDQEDIYGSPAVYAALEKHDRANDTNFFAAGPWYHGQHWADGSSLGPIHFDQDTADAFRENVLTPFLDHFLKGEQVAAPDPVTVFETGANRWRHFQSWPPKEVRSENLYLHPEGGLTFEPPGNAAAFSEFTSDPAAPVPFAPRPNLGFDYGNPVIIGAWRRWLVEDQRFVDGRPDVLTWQSAPLTEPLTVRGRVLAYLEAETTGSDADWVVKLIDVYPDDNPGAIEMSGYQLMVSADIFRGRYRKEYEKAHAIEPDQPWEYAIPLPHVNHTFQAGHRLMVQVQSSWFPLYDLNPQTFVPSIMFAKPSDYKVQRHRVHHGGGHNTRIELLVDQNR